jgi:hypothetical protein
MRKHRIGICGGLLIAAAITVAVALPSAGAAGSLPKFAFGGEAYGTAAKVGTVVKSSPTFRASLGSCTALPTDTAHQTGLATNVPGLVATATIDDTVAASTTSTSASTTATAVIQHVTLAGGLITADAVKAVSRTTFTMGSGFNYANGSSVVALTVAGHLIAAPAPNTRIDLPGLGYVILNEQLRATTSNSAKQTVNMIHLVVNVPNNQFGLGNGTDITVAHAVAVLNGPAGAGGPVSGQAFGSQANVGNTVQAGKTALVGAPCLGGFAEQFIAATKVPGLVSTGTIDDTASVKLTPASSNGDITSTIQNVSLLGGFIKADVIKARVLGSFDGATHTFTDASSFANVYVNGHQLANVGANTTIAIQGVGTLYLHRVIKGPKSLAVRMIELVVTVPGNKFGIKLGTDVQVAVASVSFRD